MNRWIGIGLAILALITIAFIVAAALFPPFREASRDIAIVILAVFQMIAAILTIVLLVAVLYAVQALQRLTRDTIIPKIDTATVKVNEILDNTRVVAGNARDSATTVTTTTVFVAERVVSPIIRVSSLMAGVRAAAGALARRGAPPEEATAAVVQDPMYPSPNSTR